jgi:hypothetical protein
MTNRSEEGRARAEAMFRKREPHTKESDKVWAERAAAGRAADANRAKLKAVRLAEEAQEAQAKPANSSRELRSKSST